MLSDPGLVPAAVTAALGLELGVGAVTAERVGNALSGRQLLLVLDNCEHMIDAAAVMAEALLRANLAARVIATSREPLRAEGEQIYPVPPLAVPAADIEDGSDPLQYDAVRLFVERTRATEPNFAPNGRSMAMLASICRRLDGNRVGSRASFGAQHRGTRRSPRRPLQPADPGPADRAAATPDVAGDARLEYGLLAETERVILRQLAVFRGAFTIAAAVAIVIDERISATDAIEGIATLAEKSLITTDTTGNITYHRLLDTTRLYALEKLAESGEIDSVQRRHASYFRDALALPASGAETGLSNEELTRRVRGIDDVRAALDWCFSPPGDIDIGVDLTAAYAPVWVVAAAQCAELAGRRRLANDLRMLLLDCVFR